MSSGLMVKSIPGAPSPPIPLKPVHQSGLLQQRFPPLGALLEAIRSLDLLLREDRIVRI